MSTDRTKGRFTKGNAGGPGRPRRQTEASYLQVMMENVPLESWGEIIQSAVTAARAGDPKSREWLARYLVGEPATVALTPEAVVIAGLLDVDDALEKAASIVAKPSIDEARYPILYDARQAAEEAAMLESARGSILEAEALRGS